MRLHGYSEKDVADGKNGPLGRLRCPYFASAIQMQESVRQLIEEIKNLVQTPEQVAGTKPKQNKRGKKVEIPSMSETCPNCPKWIFINTTDENGQPARLYNCSDVWNTQFQMENNKLVNSAGAAMEQNRNLLSDALGKARKQNKFYHGPNSQITSEAPQMKSVDANGSEPKQIRSITPQIIDGQVIRSK